MIKFKGFSHINIIVEGLEEAETFYQQLFGAQKLQRFSHFKNIGFAKAGGFLEASEHVEVSMSYLQIPDTELRLELMHFHSPKGCQDIVTHHANDLGGPRHVSLEVDSIDDAFQHVTSMDGVRLINDSPKYKPFKIDTIQTHAFTFFDPKKEADIQAKEQMAQMVSSVYYFYFIDRYGIQWEFEQSA